MGKESSIINILRHFKNHLNIKILIKFNNIGFHIKVISLKMKEMATEN